MNNEPYAFYDARKLRIAAWPGLPLIATRTLFTLRASTPSPRFTETHMDFLRVRRIHYFERRLHLVRVLVQRAHDVVVLPFPL